MPRPMPSVTTVFHTGRLYPPDRPDATAFVLVGDRIVFVGSNDQAFARSNPDEAVDLRGRLVTPAFVDAHLHAVQTGLVATGLDLHGVRSRTDLLDELHRYCRTHPSAGVVLGQGWDERYWPDPTPPTRAELDRAGGRAAVYLARVDVHSAVVSSGLLTADPAIAGAAGYSEDGLLTREAHHLARRATAELSSDDDRRQAARSTLEQCARLGVGTVHELGGPHLGPVEDLARVREAGEEVGVEVVAYWGEQASDDSLALARRLELAGLAGDLCVDGAIGSRTAALHQPYADAPTSGARYLTEEEITAHLVACTRAGLQAGFHCIGDDAVDAAVEGLRRTAELLGAPAVRAARHRLEHVEMIAPEHLPTLARLGVTASVQPAFDEAWGGAGELYEQRLGAERSGTMNPFGDLHRSGVPLAFGTDAPVTPLAGWEMVRAAVAHHRVDQRLTVMEAVEAATAGGRRAGGQPPSRLAAGASATFAIWDVDGDGALPALDDGQPAPACTGLWVRGRPVLGDARPD